MSTAEATEDEKTSFNSPSSPSTKTLNVATEMTPKDDSIHVKDMIKSKASIDNNPPIKMVPVFTYMVYLSLTVKNLLFTLVFNWSLAFTHPLNFLLLVTLVPCLSIVLLVIEISFRIGFAFGLGKALDYVGHKWGEGYSLINWWNTKIFTSDVIGIVNDGIAAMGRPLPKPAVGLNNIVFNIDIAELSLFMSSLIYERDDNIAREVYKMIANVTNHPNTVHETTENLNKAIDKLKGSESKIRAIAELWGLEFVSLTELNSMGGPFAGMFYSEEHNFIVLAFKGTTPTDFGDYVTDFLLQRVDASNFVFGEVHWGMYTSLFSQTKNRGVRMNPTSPYITIIEAIRTKAADIKEKTKTPVNIWVTGHSLGAGLASLFFARCLKSPEDLGPNCILRDGYVFGCPAIGDASFASMFSSYSDKPFDRPSTLWRVVDDTDIIAHASEDNPIGLALVRNSILDYTHAGEQVQFFQSGARPTSTRDLFPSINEQDGSKNGEPGFLATTGKLFHYNPLEKLKDVLYSELFRQPSKYVKDILEKVNESPLVYIEMMIPAFFRNHIPANYFKAMQEARKYFSNTQVDSSVLQSEK